MDFPDSLAKARAIAAKLGSVATSVHTPIVAAPVAAAPSLMKRPYEHDSYDSGADAYNKRMAYDSGRGDYRGGMGGAPSSHYGGPGRSSEGGVQDVMGVPGNLVGLIIGRGGENLKRIERETGCKVQFAQDGNPGDPERFVNLVGSPAGIADAKRQIQEIVTSSLNGDRHGAGGAGGSGGGSYGGASYGMGGGGGGGYGRGGQTQTVQIPGTKVGLVIGRGGETIRSLQERSGARIAIVPTGPEDQHATTRSVNVTGDEGAIERAKQLIDEIVNDTRSFGGGVQGTPPVTIQVPQDAIGLVIGRNGETVKQLQIQSRAKIQVQQVEPGVPPPSERIINLFGPPDAIEYAKQLIMEKVAGARDGDRYGDRGGRDQSNGGAYGASSNGGYGGYGQQQSYQASSSSGGYGSYGSYGSTAAAAATPAAAAAYTPEQQAAYAQYYGYQYGVPGAGTGAAYSAAPGTESTATPAASGATDATAAATAAYSAYSYPGYYAQYGAVPAATSAAPGTTSAAAGAAASVAAIVSAAAAAPGASTAPAAGATTTSGAPDYSAYYAAQPGGYSSEAYQQYYSQYYGYQAGAAGAATSGAGSAPGTTASEANGANGTTTSTDAAASEGQNDEEYSPTDPVVPIAAGGAQAEPETAESAPSADSEAKESDTATSEPTADASPVVQEDSESVESKDAEEESQ